MLASLFSWFIATIKISKRQQQWHCLQDYWCCCNYFGSCCRFSFFFLKPEKFFNRVSQKECYKIMHRPHYIYTCLYVYTYVCMNCEFVSSRHSICVCPSVCVQTMSLQMRMQLCASVPYLCQCVVCRSFGYNKLTH